MGYRHGRHRNIDFLKKEALKYKTRSEFAKEDCSLYAYAAKNNLLDEVCSHMCKIRGGFSVPQYICKIIFDHILGETCEYNTRKIISPYEIDIYYHRYKLAIEYNGKRWHSEKISLNKDKKLKSKEINLIVIEQGDCPSFFKNYIKHIKGEIIDRLEEINKICNKNILPETIENILIDFHDIPFNIDWTEIQKFVETCYSKSDLYRKNNYYYRLILKFNKTDMLDYLENKYKQYLKNKNYTNIKETLDFIKKEYDNYQEVIKNKKIYSFIKRYSLIKTVKDLFNAPI